MDLTVKRVASADKGEAVASLRECPIATNYIPFLNPCIERKFPLNVKLAALKLPNSGSILSVRKGRSFYQCTNIKADDYKTPINICRDGHLKDFILDPDGGSNLMLEKRCDDVCKIKPGNRLPKLPSGAGDNGKKYCYNKPAFGEHNVLFVFQKHSRAVYPLIFEVPNSVPDVFVSVGDTEHLLYPGITTHDCIESGNKPPLKVTIQVCSTNYSRYFSHDNRDPIVIKIDYKWSVSVQLLDEPLIVNTVHEVGPPIVRTYFDTPGDGNVVLIPSGKELLKLPPQGEMNTEDHHWTKETERKVLTILSGELSTRMLAMGSSGVRTFNIRSNRYYDYRLFTVMPTECGSMCVMQKFQEIFITVKE